MVQKMKCYVTSIGEPTTKLCVDILKDRFDVVLVQNNTSLWEKLKWIYNDADGDFFRVDADVIPNKNLTDFARSYVPEHVWWMQFLTFEWFRQDVGHGGVQLIKAEAIPYLREHIDEAMNKERPESYMSRIAAFYEPRRFDSHPIVMGMHGYGQKDVKRIYETKARRGQLDNYDFELAEKLRQL